MSTTPPRTSDASADALGSPSDVEELHRDLIRARPAEPVEGEEPVPKLLWVLVVATLFLGGFLLGSAWGRFGTEAHLGYVLPDKTPAPADLDAGVVASGEEIYRTRCAPCHQPNAEGLAPSFPPLVGSDWVTGDPSTLVRILLGGLAGPITVRGATYNGNMPAWAMMSDEEIARVATYVRGLSNASPVDAELVSAVRRAGTRAEPWTAEALLAAPPITAITDAGADQ